MLSRKGLIVAACQMRDLANDGDVVLVDPVAPFVDGRLYAIRSEEYNQTIAARQVFDMGRRWKLMAGDGSTVDVHKNRSELLGRIRWCIPQIREY